jgi:hypothetical protein
MQCKTETTYIHRVLKMVPRRVDVRADVHLDSKSEYIAEKIVAQVDEASLDRVSEAALANDDSGSTSVVRGKMHEWLCQRWVNLRKQEQLQLMS